MYLRCDVMTPNCFINTYKTLPEAQQTQGIDLNHFLTEINLEDSNVLVPNLAASWPGGESCVLVPNCRGNLKASYHSQTWGSASEVSVLLVFSESLSFRSALFPSVLLSKIRSVLRIDCVSCSYFL